MKILRVDMSRMKAVYEELPPEWRLIGGRGLIARIMNREVPPDTDPLGAKSKLIITGGPLAGTIAPQLGRISVGGKSPLTLGIKEANAGGPAAQKLDRLGIRAIVVEGVAPEGRLYCLKVTRDEAVLFPADEYRGMKNYRLVDELYLSFQHPVVLPQGLRVPRPQGQCPVVRKGLYKKYDKKSAIICIGIGGERKYKAASISLTDIFGDPSRNAGRGGLGAVMGARGLKAIIIDDSGTPPVDIADKILFKKTVSAWVDTLKKDITCGLFSEFGTPLAVASNSYQGTMPADSYSSGRAEGFLNVTGEIIKQMVWEHGGKMHGCMPGCVVQCSIIYNDARGQHLTSAYEYEAIALLGTNLGITDPDAIGRLKFICDDLGIDLMEIGSSLSVAASAGRMKTGDVESAISLLNEIEKGTEFGNALGNGVVATARALNISRIPAFKGQGMPAHDPRAVKGTGVTYVTSPQGADHTAGLTYKMALQKTGQKANSLRFQVQAATCDTLGYCLNSVPGGQASVYNFFADLLNARYGTSLTDDDVFEIGKQTLKDELKFNEGAEFSKIYERYPAFIRTEPLYPTNSVFDVDDSELDSFWENLDAFKQPKKIWEVRFPSLPSILFGVNVLQRLGEQVRALNLKKPLLITDPIMRKLGRVDEIQGILEESGIASAVFSGVEPDPSIELIEEAAEFYKEQGSDGLIALGGGSSMDTAKATALRVSQPGILAEYENMVGGTGKIKPPLPPIICIPTTSGTGSETSQYAVITDKRRNVKLPILSNLLIPKVAIIDPMICKSMPPALTAETGLDALSHCIEGHVSMSVPYHPYYEALAFHGVQLIGRSLRAAYNNGGDIPARTDMCMAAAFGGIAMNKGLGLGHAISHVLGSYYHVSHGRGCAVGLLCFVAANKKACQKQFSDLAWALDRSDNLEAALMQLYKDLNLPLRLRDIGIPEKDLKKIAFEITKDVANIAPNPVTLNERRVLELLNEFY